ncbi:synapsin-1 (Synapsin I) [uncultured Oscillibacter sp.]|uniref:synapsin-1 (Synapsin I) n=1 Tax=uncultured Oscillibacter sp. TaxID=876091 RepID=UPI002602F209|nr:synapsin-1 (Synapsin I) [uncultured Oscillibacter sp.]
MSNQNIVKTTGPPGRPLLPPEAEDEILTALFANMRISSGEIAAILKKHHVSCDTELLQDRYRKRLGQRLMASIRDEQGQREVLARGGEYIVLECCNDQQALQAIRRRIQSQMNGLEVSSMKVTGRIRVLDRFLSRFRKAGRS